MGARQWFMEILILSVFLAFAGPALAQEQEPVAEAVGFLRSMNSMRESLASSLVGSTAKIDEATFARVCKPVGERLQKTAAEHGWSLRQVSHKNRNPRHALRETEQAVYQQFLTDPKLETLVRRGEQNGTSGAHIYQRISVQAGCLGCHGPKDARPNFIVNKYPEDKAYGFSAGDLRGIYAAFVPTQN